MIHIAAAVSSFSFQKIDTFSQQDNTFITFLAKSTISQFSKDRKLTLGLGNKHLLQVKISKLFY